MPRVRWWAIGTRCGWNRSSSICSPTRPSTGRAVPSPSPCARTAAWSGSACATRASASPPRTCPASSTASSAPSACATTEAWGWGSTSAGKSSSPTAAGCPWRAIRDEAPPSPWISPGRPLPFERFRHLPHESVKPSLPGLPLQDAPPLVRERDPAQGELGLHEHHPRFVFQEQEPLAVCLGDQGVQRPEGLPGPAPCEQHPCRHQRRAQPCLGPLTVGGVLLGL